MTLAEVVGRNLRAFREAFGGSQEWIADRLRDFGLNWNASQLAKAERGERTFTAEQLLLIALALDLPLTELVRGDPDEWVTLTPDAAIDHTLLIAVLDSTEVRERMKLRAKHYGVSQRVRERTEARLTAEQQRWETEHAVDLVTEELAEERWGHPFIVERERRVAERLGVEWDADASPFRPVPGVPKETLAAVRGHVTRELSNELAADTLQRLARRASKTSKKARARASKKGRKR